MEQLPSNLEEQRSTAAEQARAVLDMVFTHLSHLPDDKKRSNLNNIAWSAAGEGLWGTFSDYYNGDAQADFIPVKSEERANWVVQFSESGDFARAQDLADSIKSKKVRKDAYMSIGYQAAGVGDIATSMAFADVAKESENKKDREYRKSIISDLFLTLAEQGRWEEADQIFGAEELETYNLLSAADDAAKQGEFERVIALSNRAIKQNPDQLKGRGDPDEGDWLRRPIKHAAEKAFVNGSYGFIATIGTDVEWPEDAKDDWQGWVTSGIINGVYTSEDFESGIGMFVAMALDAGEDHEVYTQLQSALDERNWTAIELIASDINSEILGMLHRLAYKEGNMEAANAFNEAMRQKDRYEGNLLLLSDDAASTMLEEAKKGNWETALELRSSTLRTFAYYNTRELIELAASQERYDVLPDLIGGDDGLLSRACGLLETRGEFERAVSIADDWLKLNPGKKSEENLPWFKLGLLNHTASTAAWLGDWPRALKALESMDELTSIDSRGHRGYEFVAIEALRTLHHTTKDN